MLLLSLKLMVLPLQQQVDRRTLLACPLGVSHCVVGIPCCSAIHSVLIFIWRKDRNHGKFKVVVYLSRFSKFKMAVQLVLRQNSRWRPSRWWSCVCSCCFDIQFKMAGAFAKVQCGNSIICITYLVNFNNTSFSNGFDSTNAS